MSTEQNEKVICNLQDSGCSPEQIDQFMKCYTSGGFKMESKTLAEHRKCLLENLHMTQKQIECLDYLVYQIQKENQVQEK